MKRQTDGPSKSGELFWRSVRYLAVCGSGYLLGLAAGSQASTPLPRALAFGLGGLALLWVFRSGRNSVAHAASDAVAAAQADARAAATASATNVVQVGQGLSTGNVGWNDAGNGVVPVADLPSANNLSRRDSYELEYDSSRNAYVFYDRHTGRRWVLDDPA